MSVILVVEDDPSNMALACAILQRAGHDIRMATNGADALACARFTYPDLLILDVSLAGPLTGLDVCRAVRADPALAATPVLMLSGWAFDTDLEAAEIAGADGYLAKPFASEELLNNVNTALVRGHAIPPVQLCEPV